jgi:hypothetical protein
MSKVRREVSQPVNLRSRTAAPAAIRTLLPASSARRSKRAAGMSGVQASLRNHAGARRNGGARSDVGDKFNPRRQIYGVHPSSRPVFGIGHLPPGELCAS